MIKSIITPAKMPTSVAVISGSRNRQDTNNHAQEGNSGNPDPESGKDARECGARLMLGHAGHAVMFIAATIGQRARIPSL